jgi:site-specific DNA-methyltransferase (adenine-specific)
LVLDNFIGTGTVAVSCLDLDRDFIGIDLSKNYCEYSDKRIEKWMNENYPTY